MFNSFKFAVVFCFCVAAHSIQAAPRLSRPRNSESVLIVYDSTGPFGWIGGLHARMLANLLGHFPLNYRIMPVESYRSGDIALSRATFYLGSVFNNPLPPQFLQEIMATDKPVCWFKYNLWKLNDRSWSGIDFDARFGFRFEFMDQSGFGEISYKGEIFSKEQLDAELGRTTILDSSRARAPAVACKAGTSDCIPYVVEGGNFWYVADLPFAYINEEDRYVVFADLLHDILQIRHPESHRAIIRLEDVDPTYPPELLHEAADYLNSESVPFAVSVIPVFNDPLGYYSEGVPRAVAISETPAFLYTLRSLISQGGQIVLHGYTHQYDAVANPYTGATGDDYEFFRVTVDAQNNLVDFKPVQEDSRQWAQDRIHDALRELRRSRLHAVAWTTPHYAASAADYHVFASIFPLTIQRVLYFDSAGHMVGWKDKSRKGMFDSNSHNAGQFFPFVIQRDLYGQKIIPENLGNVHVSQWTGDPARLPADLIRIAKKNRVVRDGWASAFFHPFLDVSYLRELVQGIRDLGYTYVSLSADVE